MESQLKTLTETVNNWEKSGGMVIEGKAREGRGALSGVSDSRSCTIVWGGLHAHASRFSAEKWILEKLLNVKFLKLMKMEL